MIHASWHKAAVAVAVASLVLGMGACGDGEDGSQPTATAEYTPEQTREAPEPVSGYTQAAPEEPESPGNPPCPPDWPKYIEYGGLETSSYPQASDYRQYFSGFNICYSPLNNDWVLYNNTEQVWSFLPGTAVHYAVAPAPDSASALFHSAFMQQPAPFVVPGEIVRFTGEWPAEIAWAPNVGLTSAWLAQSWAMEQLELSAASGSLTAQVTSLIRQKQLQASNPAGAALYQCAKSGYETGTGAAALDDASELAERLEVGLDGTTGATSCAISMRKLYKDEAQAQRDWVTRVNRTSGVASGGVDAVQAFRPILEFCDVASHVPKLGNLLKLCP